MEEEIDSALEGQSRCDVEEAQSSLSQALLLLMQQMRDYEMPEEAIAEATDRNREVLQTMRMTVLRDIAARSRTLAVDLGELLRQVATICSDSVWGDLGRIAKVPWGARDRAREILLELRDVPAQNSDTELNYDVFVKGPEGVESLGRVGRAQASHQRSARVSCQGRSRRFGMGGGEVSDDRLPSSSAGGV